MFGEEERVWCLPFTSSGSFHGQAAIKDGLMRPAQ
jgi:hypothetical protein